MNNRDLTDVAILNPRSQVYFSALFYPEYEINYFTKEDVEEIEAGNATIPDCRMVLRVLEMLHPEGVYRWPVIVRKDLSASAAMYMVGEFLAELLCLAFGWPWLDSKWGAIEC